MQGDRCFTPEYNQRRGLEPTDMIGSNSLPPVLLVNPTFSSINLCNGPVHRIQRAGDDHQPNQPPFRATQRQKLVRLGSSSPKFSNANISYLDCQSLMPSLEFVAFTLAMSMNLIIR